MPRSRIYVYCICASVVKLKIFALFGVLYGSFISFMSSFFRWSLFRRQLSLICRTVWAYFSIAPQKNSTTLMTSPTSFCLFYGDARSRCNGSTTSLLRMCPSPQRGHSVTSIPVSSNRASTRLNTASPVCSLTCKSFRHSCNLVLRFRQLKSP